MFSDITRGGQTFIHRFQMFFQVIWKSILLGLGIGLLVLGGYVYLKIPGYVYAQLISYAEAQLYVQLFPLAGSDGCSR